MELCRRALGKGAQQFLNNINGSMEVSQSILLILVINYTNQTLEHLNIYMLVIFLLETVTFIFFLFLFYWLLILLCAGAAVLKAS